MDQGKALALAPAHWRDTLSFGHFSGEHTDAQRPLARLFLVAAVSALAQWLVGGNAGIFAAMVESIFAMAKLSVEVMVLLFGTLTLWLGFLKIAEQAGIVEWLAKVLGPLFARLMPEVPPGHPALGLITMNFAANGLGLTTRQHPSA